MHSFARHLHSKSDAQREPTISTQGLVLNGGWRYDLFERFCDTLLFQGKLRGLRLKTADLAHLEGGETVLDVGCGTGTLAIEIQKRVGTAGHVFGIDPGVQQIARARYCNAVGILDTGVRRDIKKTCGGKRWPANNESLDHNSSWKRYWNGNSAQRKILRTDMFQQSGLTKKQYGATSNTKRRKTNASTNCACLTSAFQ